MAYCSSAEYVTRNINIRELYRGTCSFTSASPYVHYVTNISTHKKNWLFHNADKHLTGFLCSVCGQKFLRKSDLKAHLVTHVTGKKRYLCPVDSCEKSFHRQVHYKDHMNMHNNIKPYQCSKCMKQFFFRGSLDSHVKACMRLQLYSCDECGRCFSYPNGLRVHKQAAHTIKAGKQVNKRFMCRCGKNFLYSSSLCRHKRECKLI